MRIIAGVAKGKVLLAPKGLKTRFTSDKIRGALFNMLGQDLTDKSFLDLFAGVGTVGSEALSRGACPVVFVEKSKDNVDYIQKNLRNCNFIDKAKIYNSPFKYTLNKLTRNYFDYIFLDPPYNIYKIENILHDLITHDIIGQFSITIIEHSKKDIVPHELENLNLFRQKIYGQTVLSFYRKIKAYEKNCSLPGEF